MTAMPQMVALFNGVGGGAVALIALAEFHNLAPLGLDGEESVARFSFGEYARTNFVRAVRRHAAGR